MTYDGAKGRHVLSFMWTEGLRATSREVWHLHIHDRNATVPQESGLVMPERTPTMEFDALQGPGVAGLSDSATHPYKLA